MKNHLDINQYNDAFKTLYYLAKEGDQKQLLDFLAENKYSISLSYKNLSPIHLLALEGNHAAVDLLLQCGGSVSAAALGYAWANNQDKINETIKAGASLNNVIEGYALGNHINEVALMLQTHPELLTDALLGFARANHVMSVNKFLLEYSGTCTKSKIQHLFATIVLGYAYSENEKEIQKFNGLFLDGAESKKIFEVLFIGYGITNAKSLANHLEIILSLAVYTPYEELVLCVIYGLTTSGLVNEANVFAEKYNIQQKEYQSTCILGFVGGGYFNLIPNISIDSLLKSEMIKTLVLTKQFVYLENYFEREHASIVIKNFADLIYDSNDTALNYLLSFIKNKENRACLIQEAITNNFVSKEFQYKKIIDHYKINYDAAKDWSEHQDLRAWLTFGAMTLIIDDRKLILTNDILIRIASYLAPNLNHTETKNLYDAVTFCRFRLFFANDLEKQNQKDAAECIKKIEFKNELFQKMSEMQKNFDESQKHFDRLRRR